MTKSGAQLMLIDLILSDPVKLRDIDPDHVDGIAESFLEQGQQQPIRIRPTDTGFQVVFGEHRLAAARLLNQKDLSIKGLPMGQIMAIVEKIDKFDSYELKITENAHRNSFVDPWAEGKVLKELLAGRYDGDLDAMAKKIGKTHQYIQDRTRVYDCLDPSLRQYIGVKGGLSIANTITLAKYLDTAVQVALAKRIIESKDIQKKRFISWGGGGGGGGGKRMAAGGWLAPKPKVELQCICKDCGNIHKRPSFSVEMEPEIPDVDP